MEETINDMKVIAFTIYKQKKLEMYKKFNSGYFWVAGLESMFIIFLKSLYIIQWGGVRRKHTFFNLQKQNHYEIWEANAALKASCVYIIMDILKQSENPK